MDERILPATTAGITMRSGSKNDIINKKSIMNFYPLFEWALDLDREHTMYKRIKRRQDYLKQCKIQIEKRSQIQIDRKTVADLARASAQDSPSSPTPPAGAPWTPGMARSLLRLRPRLVTRPGKQERDLGSNSRGDSGLPDVPSASRWGGQRSCRLVTRSKNFEGFSLWILDTGE
jgi:hypothetical protein